MYHKIIRDGNDFVVDAPCGCPECTKGVRQGHSYCDPAPAGFAELENDGVIHRAYGDGRWRWFLTNTDIESRMAASDFIWIATRTAKLLAERARRLASEKKLAGRGGC